jgi:DNA-directed RNA polymerase subunit RPC12/RpoP
MSRNFCPKCEKDIFQAIYDEEIHDFDNGHKFICPYCGAKLLVGMTWEYFVEEDEETNTLFTE